MLVNGEKLDQLGVEGAYEFRARTSRAEFPPAMTIATETGKAERVNKDVSRWIRSEGD